MQSPAQTSESILNLTRRVKERQRRERLNRRIGALETKLKKITEPYTRLERERVWRLTSMIKRLEAELRQPELFL